MRLALIALVAMALSGCGAFQSPEEQRCEAQLLDKLKSPASYKRVSSHVTDIDPDDPANLSSVTERWVTIEYDAVNSFNAPLRGTEICRYPLKNGQADVWNSIDDAPVPIVEDMTGTVEPDNTAPAPPEARPAEPDTPEADDIFVNEDGEGDNISFD